MIDATKSSLTPALLKIHENSLLAGRDLKKAEKTVIESLIEVEGSGLHFRVGCSSMLQYVMDHMELSEAVALNAIAVARKVREVPELRSEVQTIGISKIRKMVSVLTRENQKEWIERAKTVSTRALEKAVAKENPRAATPESAKYVSEKRLDLRLGVSEELMLKIRRGQDQVSRSLNKSVTLEETLDAVFSDYLHRKDPLEKAKRVIARKGPAPATRKEAAKPDTAQPQTAEPQTHSANTRFTGTVTATPRKSSASADLGARQAIPAAIAHQIRVRDQAQCQATRPGGGVCGEKRWIDLHHIIPVSQGGTNAPENLTTFCRAHHREHHRGG